MQLKYLAIAGIIICGTAMHSVASAESEAVTARTKAMSEISDNMRVLGLMLKGQVNFDLDSAKSAIQNIQKLADQTPTLFEIEAVDPHADLRLARDGLSHHHLHLDQAHVRPARHAAAPCRCRCHPWRQRPA